MPQSTPGMGQVIAVGRAFGVFQIKGLPCDFALPRRDSKVGSGHRGFDVEVDPHLGIEEASARRDLTINSIAKDPFTGELLDPWGGQEDLRAGVLRATSAEHFAEDPLRGLRVMQFGARFESIKQLFLEASFEQRVVAAGLEQSAPAGRGGGTDAPCDDRRTAGIGQIHPCKEDG